MEAFKIMKLYVMYQNFENLKALVANNILA